MVEIIRNFLLISFPYKVYLLYDPGHKKTEFLHMQKVHISCAVTAQLISTFVFSTRIVQFLFFLNLKFQASSHIL